MDMNLLMPFIIGLNGIILIASELVDWEKLGERFRKENEGFSEEYLKMRDEWNDKNEKSD